MAQLPVIASKFRHAILWARILQYLLFMFLSISAVIAVWGIPSSFDWLDAPISTPHALLNLVVVMVGILLVCAGWRFPSLRLNKWHVLLIFFGAVGGALVSALFIGDIHACCAWVYSVYNGFPFRMLWRGFSTDTYVSWGEMGAYLRQHHIEVDWRTLNWNSLVGNAFFFAHLSIILLIVCRYGLRFFTQRRKLFVFRHKSLV